MKNSYSQAMILVTVILFGFLLSGFQCGSTEMTSAKLYIQNKDYVNAEKSLEKEVAKNPANAEAWYDLGLARFYLQKYPEMVTALNKSLEAGPEFTKQANDMKLNAWGNAFNAGVNAQKKLDTAPKDSQAVYAQQAVDKYQLALSINPDSAATYQNLAAVYHTTGDVNKEIGTWEQALRKRNDPQYTLYLINAEIKKYQEDRTKGDTMAVKADLQKTLADLETARKADPGNIELLTTMINLYIESGHAKDAMPYIREALEKDPSNKIYQNDLGLLLLQTDSLEAAAGHFDAALATDANFEDALRNGAVAYMKIGQQMKENSQEPEKGKKGKKEEGNKAYVDKFKQAVGYLERLTKLKPENPDFWDALATAYGNAGMYKDAERAVKTADNLRKK